MNMLALVSIVVSCAAAAVCVACVLFLRRIFLEVKFLNAMLAPKTSTPEPPLRPATAEEVEAFNKKFPLRTPSDMDCNGIEDGI